MKEVVRMRQTKQASCVVRVVARLAAMMAVTGILMAMPFDWARIGQTATLLAAGMQRPANAAQILDNRHTSAVDSTAVIPPANAAPTTSVTAPPADSEAEMPASVTNNTPPVADGTGGAIVSRTITGGNALRDGVAFRNSSGVSVDMATALNAALTPSFTKTDAPQVLIVHTHTTEGYMTYDAGRYNAADRERTHDHSRSVCAAGEALKSALAAYGVVAIHDTSVHDSPYAGAYTRSAKTVEKYLAEYPSIQVVLDLHRDALMDGDTTLVKPTVSIDGKAAAQIMIIAGVLSTAALPNPHTAQNLALAAQWQRLLEGQYRGLARPLSTVGSRYNQYLHAGYLLVEVGSEANTVEEAVYSATILGKTLAELLQAG